MTPTNAPHPEKDPFFTPDAEQLLSLETIHGMQDDIEEALEKYAHEPEKAEKVHAHILAAHSDKFVELLVMPESQKHYENIVLSQPGFDMISHVLKQKKSHKDAPDARTLYGLNRIVKNQEVGDPITPPRPADSPLSDEEYAEAFAQKPRYITRFDNRIGPFESPEEDLIADIKKRLDPEFWFMPDEMRDFYEQVMEADEIVGDAAKIYVQAIDAALRNTDQVTFDLHGKSPEQIFREDLKDEPLPSKPYRFRLGKPLRKPYAEYKEKRDKEDGSTGESISEEELEFSRRIIAKFQNRNPNLRVVKQPQKSVNKAKADLERVMLTSEALKDKDMILAKVKQAVSPQLTLDDELRYLKSEQEIGDEASSQRIETFLVVRQEVKSRIASEREQITRAVENGSIKMSLLEIEEYLQDFARAIEEQIREEHEN